LQTNVLHHSVPNDKVKPQVSPLSSRCIYTLITT